ncbi:MAG: putative DNA binding domain-containing protein, partial [Mariprofundaceae bacterium]|nr:putative DNA binding domain-containing protein [Mariprofundaceae bacterium]
GGHIILGVNDQREVTGVVDVDTMQNDFIGQLQNPERFGSPIRFEEYLKAHEDKNVLIFYIHEAQRRDKPVYVKSKKKGREAFVRRGGGDYACNKADLDRMINDALQDRPDGQLFDFDASGCFDERSLKWFRHRYENKGGNRSLLALTDHEFLIELGLLVESKGEVLPTMASILLLGKASRVRQLMPRPIVDCLRYGFDCDHANTGKRWDKRVTCEYNIVESWQAILDWYNSFTDTPFNLDMGSGQRSDFPPDFIAFRESVINLLSHQDFTDQTRWPVIEDYRDLTRFVNPGDAFASVDKLLEPGSKEVRNPIIVRALRYIGFSEQSGWGLREVYRNWHELGRVPPELVNDKAEKTFELKLRRKRLMSEQQVLLQSQIGIRLTADEADAFANLCATKDAQISVSMLRAALGMNGSDTARIVQRLVVQGVVTQPSDALIALAEHLIPLKDKIFGVTSNTNEHAIQDDGDLSTEQVKPQTPDLSTEQVEPLASLNPKQKTLLTYCEIPRTMANIMAHLNVGSRGYFKANHLDPLLKHGLVVMTNPENARASNQSYVITEIGIVLMQGVENNEVE